MNTSAVAQDTCVRHQQVPPVSAMVIGVAVRDMQCTCFCPTGYVAAWAQLPYPANSSSRAACSAWTHPMDSICPGLSSYSWAAWRVRGTRPYVSLESEYGGSILAHSAVGSSDPSSPSPPANACLREAGPALDVARVFAFIHLQMETLKWSWVHQCQNCRLEEPELDSVLAVLVPWNGFRGDQSSKLARTRSRLLHHVRVGTLRFARLMGGLPLEVNTEKRACPAVFYSYETKGTEWLLVEG